MGRVFNYTEIEQGKVPEPGDFQKARAVFQGLAETAIASGYVDGVIIFGSVAAGTPSLRSDFDNLISLSDSQPGTYESMQQMMCEFNDEIGGKVPLEPAVYPRAALEAGTHDMNRTFGGHLCGESRVVMGNDPAQYMTYWGEQTGENILARYFFHKRKRLTKTYTAMDQLDLSGGGLQRMLELPNAIGRITLQLLAEIGYVSEPAPEGADKRRIAQHAPQLFEQLGIGDNYMTLRNLNAAYTMVLEKAVAGSLSKQEYDEYLAFLHSHLPLALQWIEQAQQAILPLFKVSAADATNNQQKIHKVNPLVAA